MVFDLLTSPQGHQFDPMIKILLAFCSDCHPPRFDMPHDHVWKKFHQGTPAPQSPHPAACNSMYIINLKTLHAEKLCRPMLFVVCWFFFKINLLKTISRYTIRVSTVWIQIRPDIYIVGPGLGPNCLRWFSADDTTVVGLEISFSSDDINFYFKSLTGNRRYLLFVSPIKAKEIGKQCRPRSDAIMVFTIC